MIQSKSKLVIILSRFPFPLTKGDKLRAFHQMVELSKQFQIHCICISDEQVSDAHFSIVKNHCETLTIHRINKLRSYLQAIFAVFTKEPSQIAYFYRYAIHRKIRKKIIEIKPTIVYCQLIRVAKYTFDFFGSVKVIDYMDPLSMGLQRRIKKTPFYLKWLYRRESSTLQQFENKCFDYFDARTIISEVDRNCIMHPERNKIEVIKNGIDSSHFEELHLPKKYDLVFTGNMSYPPNFEAAKYIQNEILPLLKKHFPHIQIAIAGASMPEYLKKNSDENIHFLGWVDDIRVIIQESRTYLAPMFIGTGLQNKLLEAMAAGVPCVTTTLCNNSLQAKHNQTILLAEDAIGLTNQLIYLLENPEKASSIAKEAKAFVLGNYSWKLETEKLIRFMLKN